ncbi:MAG: phosphoadenosine phosphosulfate reductase family protein, partial [Proteobacteria bacterium]|nr:phosphoadenosine phosphosulfate reductase family protein [Pseudomonadota bacterium]
MYAYVWNPDTGGFRLTTDKLLLSKEPRPVYARELDILGFNKHFKYDPQMDVPYMWAEANNYWYRGRQIAKTVGGSLYTAPKLELLDADGIETLAPVDIQAMVEENAEIFKALVQATIKKIYDTYKRYRNKVEIFFVSYSGGKDSEVMLDLVQRTLPHSDFIVLFSDTGMEFPDTYIAVKHIQNKCLEWKINFHIARSHYTPEETWELFGPPSNTMRWCCSVHKTAPQILKLRDIIGKSSFKDMAFIGVRGDDSQKRSSYEYISYGKKHNGQYSCYPILEWNSAEVFLYLYTYNIHINEAYKKGNSRAGCLVCPMSGDKADSMRY